MIDLNSLQEDLLNHEAGHFRDSLMQAVNSVLTTPSHGDLHQWIRVLDQLPELKPSRATLDSAAVTIGQRSDISNEENRILLQCLKDLMPWRKGPYSLFGNTIDSEWQSDWKWNRLASEITTLRNCKVLDIGCGNAYHCWRMKAAGARLVIGIDPNLLFTCQFCAVQKYAQEPGIHMLPITLEAMPPRSGYFDTVFSMGVLYHRRSPIDHLRAIHGQLREGGELVLETLVVEGDEKQVLIPPNRYARMRNVWFIPSSAALCVWLNRCGFKDIRLVDETITTTEEQRSTDWMYYESLAESLDKKNPALTVENLPAPKRAVLIARRN